ncbi:Alpha/Beta hydrolase protein [Hyaloraphidium curvatum]|nr:Alpha/Beta hydrolase protein [Hyaloraphidium curvatum]
METGERPSLLFLLLRQLGVPAPDRGAARAGFLLAGLVSLPFLAALSVFALPAALAAFALLQLAAAGVYLVYADASALTPLFSPLRALRVARCGADYVADFLSGPLPAALRWMLRTLAAPPAREKLRVSRGVPYSSHFSFDVYPCAPGFPLPRERTRFPRRDSEDATLAPVLVILHGGFWRSGDKAIYGPAARWWRDKGFVVVVGNYGIYPKSRLHAQLHSLRSLLLSVHDSIRAYGGSPSRIFLLAHDSGAHLALLSLLLDAETASAPPGPGSPPRSGTESGSEASRGRRSSVLARSGPRLPPIEGVILVGGVYDVVEQDRWERSRGWEHVSALNRVMGPSLPQASPLHRLSSLLPSPPPPTFPRRWWLVHGSRDPLVPCAPAREFAALLEKYLSLPPSPSPLPGTPEGGDEGRVPEAEVRTWFPPARHFDLVAGTVFDTSPYAAGFEEGGEEG